MKATVPTAQRCAIYTRKSTEHNLDLAFNSLDAQREACEAYIKSQAHEGWRLVPGHYDDGGLSGASLDRPALQQLLADVAAKKLDIIVVYKVDRLTRSLADFAKLVELFDANDVFFVSVTQSFNTTSSMGRLTLNVLLSFAQFEREVIGERVRDKIAASKRKGIWVGGPVPLGYRSVAKKIEVVPEEAALVRRIFEDCLRLGAIGALAAALNSEGVKPRARLLTNGKHIAAAYFRVGPLAHMLKNRFYIGEIVYRGEIHKGEHEPILNRDLFDAVQGKVAERKVARKLTRSRSPSFLVGVIFDDRGNPMSPSHANKRGVRYRYYVSQALLQNRKAEAGSIPRVSAPDTEELVCNAVRQTMDSEDAISDRDLIERKVARVTTYGDRIAILLRADESEPENTIATTLDVPFVPNLIPKKGIVHAPADKEHLDPRGRDALLESIARARTWMDAINAGSFDSFGAIAVAEGLGERHVRRLAPLAFLSPKIVRAIADGDIPRGLTVSDLAQALPDSWSVQEQMLGLR